MEFYPTSSAYPAQSHVEASAGFGDEWEKTPSLLENHEKCILEISPACSYHWQHSVAWENSSAHPGRTGVIHLLSSTRQQAQVVTHPITNRDQCFLTCRIWLRTVCAMPSHHWSCNSSWEHFMSHKMYYMSYTIDKWNVYCSYIIKCIFAGKRISRFDHAEKIIKNLHHSATFSAGCWREPRMLICLA